MAARIPANLVHVSPILRCFWYTSTPPPPLLSFFRQYLSFKKRGDTHNELLNLLIIEEAHRIIPNVDTQSKMSEGSTRNKERSVESFNNAIAEMRAYGVGVVVADQSPSRVSLDVLRNVGTKIFHGIQERDDQDAAASLLGFTLEEASCLAALPDRGFAFLRTRSSGLKRPSLVKIRKFDGGSRNKKLAGQASAVGSTSVAPEWIMLHETVSFLLADGAGAKIPTALLQLVQYQRTHYGIPASVDHSTVLNKTFHPEFNLRKEECRGCRLKCRVPLILNTLAPQRFSSVADGNPTRFGDELARFIEDFDVFEIHRLESEKSLMDRARDSIENFLSTGSNSQIMLSPEEMDRLVESTVSCAMAHRSASKYLAKTVFKMRESLNLVTAAVADVKDVKHFEAGGTLRSNEATGSLYLWVLVLVILVFVIVTIVHLGSH